MANLFENKNISPMLYLEPYYEQYVQEQASPESIIVGIIIVIVLYFVIDLTCIYTINRPLFAIKEDNDSVNIIYKGLFYNIYDCFEYAKPQIKSKKAKFNCSILEVKLKDESKYRITNEALNISIKKNSVTQVEVILDIKNDTNYTYTYGQSYTIEKYVDGKWYVIEPKNDLVFNSIGYTIKPKEIKKIKINWEYHYGKLPSGKYRIVKDVFRNIDIPVDESDNYYIASEFTI